MKLIEQSGGKTLSRQETMGKWFSMLNRNTNYRVYSMNNTFNGLWRFSSFVIYY